RHADPAGLPPSNGYSHLVVAPPGRLVAISGQVALDARGNPVGAGDFHAQCVQVFENLKRALAAEGLGFEDVLRLDMYVTDMDNIAILREVRDRYLTGEHPPASTLVQVQALVRPELEVEIAALAVAPAPRGAHATAGEARP